ncbi:hypothetical protein ACTFIY_011277 [Dictyostelium cf. discoideum]
MNPGPRYKRSEEEVTHLIRLYKKTDKLRITGDLMFFTNSLNCRFGPDFDYDMVKARSKRINGELDDIHEWEIIPTKDNKPSMKIMGLHDKDSQIKELKNNVERLGNENQTLKNQIQTLADENQSLRKENEYNKDLVSKIRTMVNDPENIKQSPFNNNL